MKPHDLQERRNHPSPAQNKKLTVCKLQLNLLTAHTREMQLRLNVGLNELKLTGRSPQKHTASIRLCFTETYNPTIILWSHVLVALLSSDSVSSLW